MQERKKKKQKNKNYMYYSLLNNKEEDGSAETAVEQSTTGGIAGYQTPYAFSKNGKTNKATKYAQKLGMIVMSENFESIIESLNEEEFNLLKSLFN